MRLLVLFCVVCASSFAQSWSGILVDANCYASQERNHNPTDTLTSVDRDIGAEIRYCRPSAKAKSFAVVGQDGQSFMLDPAGNAQAARLVPKSDRKAPMRVAVTGEMHKDTVRVRSISLVK